MSMLRCLSPSSVRPHAALQTAVPMLIVQVCQRDSDCLCPFLAPGMRQYTLALCR